MLHYFKGMSSLDDNFPSAKEEEGKTCEKADNVSLWDIDLTMNVICALMCVVDNALLFGKPIVK